MFLQKLGWDIGLGDEKREAGLGKDDFESLPSLKLACQPKLIRAKAGAGEGIRTLDPNLGKISKGLQEPF